MEGDTGLYFIRPHVKPARATIKTDAELDAADAAGGVVIPGMIEDHADEDHADEDLFR